MPRASSYLLNTELPPVQKAFTHLWQSAYFQLPPPENLCLVFHLAHQSHCPAQNHSKEAVRKLLAGSMLPHAAGRHL